MSVDSPFASIVAASLFVGCSAGPSMSAPPAPAPIVMPGPATLGVARARAMDNASCVGCHAEIAAEWRASMHREAHQDPAFQRALAIEPLAFCRGCHAPEADPARAADALAASIGVGCVSCHASGDAILAAPREPLPSGRLVPHGLVRDARFAGEGACGGCHEFAFPESAGFRAPPLMQSTVREHGASPEAGASCASCHMPDENGHKSHAFGLSRDPKALAEALVVSASRPTATRLRLVLTPSKVGHAFPTGDLFRRLSVEAEVIGVDEMVVASARRYLTRHFVDRRAGFDHVIRDVASDDRPLGGPETIDLELGEPARQQEIRYRVSYQRVDHPRSDDAREGTIESEVELARGRLEDR